ncbi:RNA polymerase associated protein RapA [hydrothermal vent metagenome]|uniref:RNA polymerase associated protein RapA n=1 Tax=hydrothermal vent metagenome TaxID=652676 RepID=A0A3B0Z2J6_9ZZZZ
MQDFIPDQRWVSSAELSLGLGTIVGTEHRRVTLIFPATGETRTYARQGAPLSRVRFAPDDTLLDADDHSLRVVSVEEQDGLLTYIGTDNNGQIVKLHERDLNSFIQLNRPGERLFSGQVDKVDLFDLRYSSWQHISRLNQSDLFGLTGCRTSLIPHQLYIAHEVGSRYAPRVLLADEVGLGKTIEAGLILHQQLLTERARRVLIVVPESLIHQWLVEMLRRFNLLFSIFDEQRCQAVDDSGVADNPFHSEQRVLCSLNFISANPARLQQAVAGEWDLLIVDEAHHLGWSPDEVSHEYQCIEQLADVTPGVLLLTATPEQLGRASHFARLRLLDRHRFPDLASFISEEERYEPVARAVQQLLSDRPIDADSLATLTQTLQDEQAYALLHTLNTTGTGTPNHQAAREALISQLLDRHGTGRMLFRNTRAAVKGFPQRQLHAYPLPLPAAYAAANANRLCPECDYDADTSAEHWTEIDPRVDWLASTLAALKPEKALVIAANATTAIELVEFLYNRTGIHAAIFHEGLSLVARDRAAAFFADQEAGTQVLVCSEVGSEGRNFQFAHHLILFDLPLNPDLLEQRIGRLDRIGQTNTVQIHVPYLQGSAQAVLFNWYHRGLSAFEQICPAGQLIYTELQADLFDCLLHPDKPTDELITTAKQLNESLNQALQRGRDRLLEYNSCRQPAADQLCASASALENTRKIADYMDKLFDAFGVDSRLHSEGCLVINPGEHMLHPLPGLPEEGLTITYDRDIALAFEDAQYLSWEHPLITGSMDLLLSSELGNCAVTAAKLPNIKPGSLLLECIYILETTHADLAGYRLLPPSLIRIVVDEHVERHDCTLDTDPTHIEWITVNTDTARQIVQARDLVLRQLLDHCNQLAQQETPKIITTVGEQTKQRLEAELHRLQALARHNSNVREEEIRFFAQQLALMDKVLTSATPRLDSVRVIVAT